MILFPRTASTAALLCLAPHPPSIPLSHLLSWFLCVSCFNNDDPSQNTHFLELSVFLPLPALRICFLECRSQSFSPGCSLTYPFLCVPQGHSCNKLISRYTFLFLHLSKRYTPGGQQSLHLGTFSIKRDVF